VLRVQGADHIVQGEPGRVGGHSAVRDQASGASGCNTANSSARWAVNDGTILPVTSLSVSAAWGYSAQSSIHTDDQEARQWLI
jgi:hypothetical protein